MGYIVTSVLLYLLLLCIAVVPISYSSDLLHHEYTNVLSDVENEEPINRHVRNVQFNSNYVKKDNRKPALDCSNYNPTVDEDQSPGAYVMTVKATDEDVLDKITYKFQQKPEDRSKFSINETTGVITTNIRFDRDDVPSRQKEMYVTVLATDNGTPRLFDVCTFKISINDINDNSPLFDKSVYSESIPEDLQVNKEVMRIYATDNDDGNNSVISYSLDETNPYYSYFNIDDATGIITLKKPIPPGLVNSVIKIHATAKDAGYPSLKADIDLEIRVVDSNKKAPTFTSVPPGPIQLLESITDYDTPIATLTAVSNLKNTELQFHLFTGRTESTNKGPTFLLQSNNSSTALLKLRSSLDYEAITEYTLTVRVTNTDSLSAVTKVIIKVLDVNDNIPSFMELVTENEISGSVSENEPANTPVMQVQAADKDGTSPNNIVKYELADHKNLFDIDPNTGEIKTKTSFDREEARVYNVKVKAKDSAPSSLYKNGLPNEAEQVFRIEIDDKNDNPPKFTQSVYVADNVLESTDTNKMVIEVKAEDKDTASVIVYEIIDGNGKDAFYIDRTGKIKVKNKLDYEDIESYELKVMAHDGKYNDTAIVKILIRNENDEVPIFDSFLKEVTIEEETLVENCLVQVRASDPDKKPNEPQDIIYSVASITSSDNFLSVDGDGCVKLTMKLDRDPPKGIPRWQALITATDEKGGIGCQSYSADFFIKLIDINDNAPTLKITEVIWPERKNITEGPITVLEAEDNDEVHNGPPFTYEIALNATDDIKAKFTITADRLDPLIVFDREEQKEYMVPISITDSGKLAQTGISYLKVIIGDVNDNAMEPGESSIYVNTRKNMPDTIIGRVYVKDKDDWDLPYKNFEWNDSTHQDKFELNTDTGELTMLRGTQSGTYQLNFIVSEVSPFFSRHQVNALVTVVVKEIPDEAILKSGSIRLLGNSAEDFIDATNKRSMKDTLQDQLAHFVNVSLENLDIVSILHPDEHKDENMLDIRYSAHGSPYRYPEELNTITTMKQEQLYLFEWIYMVNVAECLSESVCPEYSCTNYLNISDVPYVVNTNTTSYVGVSATVQPKCSCSFRDNYNHYCLNGGEQIEDALCQCESGFEGPHCEALSISFLGTGFAMYPPFETCNDSLLTLEVVTTQKDGLIFYVGPLRKNYKFPVRDFMSLELRNGYPVLLMDYGSGTVQVEQGFKRLNDGERHIISVNFNTKNVQLNVDNCPTSDCLAGGYSDIPGPNRALNVNGPLQLGGAVSDLKLLAAEMSWNHTPTDIGFIGCINNLTYNRQTYNLGQPRYGKDYSKDCNNQGPQAAAFGIDSNFLVALLVCLAILLILLLAVVVHRRKHDHWNEKELDDIRETIINYEDEGGGEVDTGFDLELLRRENQFDEPHIKKQNDLFYGRAPEEVPDINGFLKDKKDACDKDPDFNPFDDVRYYAYEGDGNTSRSSLSSLASCTDEGDLKFNYLSNFGPRFRKLADMYGEEPSDEEDNDGGEESWC